MILLDTHVAIWLLADDPKLGRRCSRRVDRELHADAVTVSAFSFWEIGTLIENKRLRAVGGADEMRARLLGAGVREVSIDGPIAMLAAKLRSFHGDPADRLIAATALEHGATLVTADQALLAWTHGLKTMDATR